MTDKEKLYQAYYEPDRLWTGGKAIKELHKNTSRQKKNIKSWLAKQALWQVHIPPPKEINDSHYDMTKPNKQHQFDLLYMPHNLFEGNKYKYILTAIDVASRYKPMNKSFKPMDLQELQDPEKVSTIWVKNLNKTVNKMNNTVSSMTDMKPKDAIKLDTFPLDKKYHEETIFPEDGLYRYLYQPGKQHGDQKRRTTDHIWSKNTYRLDRIVKDPGNRVLYY